MKSRRRILAIRAIGLALVLSAAAGTPRAAAVGEQFGGYEAAAMGSAYTVYPAIPTFVPYDASIEGTVSLSNATLSTGGVGWGRASTFWPGIFAGLPQLLKLLAPQFPPLPNYPLVQEAREYDKPKRTEQAGTVMATDIRPDRAHVESAADSFGAPGSFSIGNAKSVSTSSLENSKVIATSTATVEDIEFAAGVVRIGSVVTTSTASSDAVKGSCAGKATVSGLVIGGTPAVVDDQGVRARDQQAGPGPNPNDAIDAALKQSGMQMRVIGGFGNCDGPAASRSTAGLLVSMPVPAGGPIPPGGTLNVVIGSTSVSVAATPTSLLELDESLPDLSSAELPSVSTVDPPAAAAPQPAQLGSLFGAIPVGEPVSATPVRLSTAEPAAAYSFGGVPISMIGGLFLLAIPGVRRIRAFMLRLFTMGSA